MQALILAGGEGSRLAASGVTTPKALVEVDGEPQLARLMAACRRAGAPRVTVALRADLQDGVRRIAEAQGATILPVRTESSLHTLAVGAAAMRDGPLFCVLVDTVVPEADWLRAHAEARTRLHTADMVVAVTPYVHDESPLWVRADHEGQVLAFGERGPTPLVTGGMYWLSQHARLQAARAVTAGVSRLRNFLTRLAESRAVVTTVTIPRIIDIDTATDLAEAIVLLEASRA